MSAETVKKAYESWQYAESAFGARNPVTLESLSDYIFTLYKNGEECDTLIEKFKARLENYKDWKNKRLPGALASVAYVLNEKQMPVSAYPLIRRAAVIADYFSAAENFDASTIWLVSSFVLRSLKLYREEIFYDEKLYEYALKTEGESSNDIIFYLMRLDYASYYCERYAKARQYSERALALNRKYHPENTNRTLVCLSNLAFNLVHTGPPEEEIRIREEELDLAQRIHGSQSAEAVERYEKLCNALSKYSSGSLHVSENLFERARSHYYRLLALKTSVSGPSDPSTLKTMRGLIALFEKGREYSHAIDLQKDLVNKSRDQNSPPAFFSNRDRFHLVEMYRDAGMLREAIQLADALLSELTEDLDPETVAQSLKSKSPSIDITGIMQLRVFLQKYKRI